MFEIGTTLREARVRRNLTLQQIEDDTKIRVKYVQAMENEDFDIMPGATYVKGFLRTYSEYLGLDPEVILGEYRSRSGPVREVQEPFGGVSMLGAPRGHRGRNTVVLVAVICLLVLAAIWVLGRNTGGTNEPTTKPGALGLNSPSPSPSPSVKPSSAANPEAKSVVTITAKDGDCWVQVRRDNSTGIVLWSGTIKKGDSRKFKGQHLWMSFGNPVVVRLEAGGKKVKLKSDVGPWPVTFDAAHGRVLQGTQTQG